MAYNGSFSLVPPQDGAFIGNLGIDLNLDANNQILFSSDGLSIDGLNISNGLQKNNSNLETVGNPNIQLVSNSIFVNENVTTVQSAIDNITQADVVYISSGSHTEPQIIINNKYNIALQGPDVGNTLCQLTNGIEISGTSELIRLANLQIYGSSTKSSIIKGVGRYYFKNVIFSGTSSINHGIEIGKDSTKFMTFNNCEFDEYCTITISNLLTAPIFFINCNFAGCTINYQNVSPFLVLINNCAGLVSYPTTLQATLIGLNVLTTGNSQVNATNINLSTINGASYPPSTSNISVTNQSNTQITYCTNTSNILTSNSNLTFNEATNTLSTSNLNVTNINGIVYEPYIPGSGTSSGNLYYFDATTNNSTGSMLLSPNTGTQTTITYTWSNDNTEHLICTFITPATTLATPIIGSGNWDAEMYVSTSSATPQMDFFFKYYYVDANGTSNKTLIKNGSGNTTLCGSVSSTPPPLLLNSLYIDGLTLPSTTTRIIAELYFIVPSGNPNGKSAIVYFRNGTLSHIQTTLLGFPPASFQDNTQTANNIVLANGSNVIKSGGDLTWNGTRLSLYSSNPLTIGRGNNASSDATNTAMGYQSLNAITTGISNTCYGYNSGVALTTQNRSTMIGSGASTTSTGSDNVSVGFSSRAGSSSVSVGSSCYSVDASVSVGSACGRAAMNGSYNVLMGFTCANALTTGNGNCCIGSNNSLGITTGTNNTIVGISSGTTQTTQSNNTICGYYSDIGAYSNSGIFGANIRSIVNGSNQIQIGDSSTTVYTYASATRASDMRDKAEIRDTQFGLDFISKLRPRDYKFDYRESYQEFKDIKDENGIIIGTEFIEYPRDGSKKRNRFHCGLIAQELKQTMDELNTDFAGYIDFQHNDPGLNVGEFERLTIKYEELICPLIKAVQELKLKNDQLEERLKVLENK